VSGLVDPALPAHAPTGAVGATGDREREGSIAPDGAGSIGFKREKLKTEMLKAEKGREDAGDREREYVGVRVCGGREKS
jgi:hypothetical protein